MDGTYAPQSPDLSSFLSSPPKTQQPYNHNPQPTSQSSYAPRSPVIPSFTNPVQHNLQYAPNPNVFDGASDFAEYGSTQYMPPIPALPPQHSFTAAYPPQTTNTNTNNTYLSPSRPARRAKNEISYSELDAEAEDDYLPTPISLSQNMSSRGPRIKAESSMMHGFNDQPQAQETKTMPYKNPNPDNIEIRTKFPVARIKRIMQADEEVGKVAQVTPVAVSKALELFMIALVGGAAEKAREKGGKKITAQHLKAVVEGNPDQFDFLQEIVGRVAEVQEGAGGEGRKRKEKVEGSSDSDEEKKPKKGRGRKKKSDE